MKTKEQPKLKPCPFCGGKVHLEQADSTFSRMYGERHWYGVVCRNTGPNVGGSCCMDQVPSASIKAAVDRWNMRDGKRDPAFDYTPPTPLQSPTTPEI